MNESFSNKLISQVAALSVGKIAIISAFLTGMYFMMFFNSGETIQVVIDGLNSQLQVENEKKIETSKALQKEEQMRADVTLMVKKYQEVKAKIPIEFLESELREIIDQISNRHFLKTIKNQRSTSIQDMGTSDEATLVQQVALDYSFSGTFSDFMKFMEEVSQTEKLIRIGNFTLVPTTRTTGEVRSPNLIFTTTMIGFKQSSFAINDIKKEVSP